MMTLAPPSSKQSDQTRDTLMQLEDLFDHIRPRLFYIAQLQGVPYDSCEDIVQETLLAAWSHLDQLRDPSQIIAWLIGICRNQCRMYLRTKHHIQLEYLANQADWQAIDKVEPGYVIDPQQLVDRRELCTLLEQALATLSAEAREVIYLCDLLQEEKAAVAIRLGIAVKTLRVRLYRARQDLRRVLHGRFRQYTQDHELPLSLDYSADWYEAKEWCPVCGQHRLRSYLDKQPDGISILRMRCPSCSLNCEHDVIAYTPPEPKSWLTSRSTSLALRQMREYTRKFLYPYLLHGLTHEIPCDTCQYPVRAHLVGLEELLSTTGHIHVQIICPHCYSTLSIPAGLISCTLSDDPTVQHFFNSHPRWIAESDQLAEWNGEQVCHFRLIDSISSKQLNVLAHPQSLKILIAYIKEIKE